MLGNPSYLTEFAYGQKRIWKKWICPILLDGQSMLISWQILTIIYISKSWTQGFFWHKKMFCRGLKGSAELTTTAFKFWNEFRSRGWSLCTGFTVWKFSFEWTLFIKSKSMNYSLNVFFDFSIKISFNHKLESQHSLSWKWTIVLYM